MNQTINTAKINKGTKVGQTSNLAFNNITRLNFCKDFFACFGFACFNNCPMRKNQTVLTRFNFNNLKFELFALVLIEIFNEVIFNHGCRNESTDTCVNNQTTFNHTGNRCGNGFAGFVFSLDFFPNLLCFQTALGQ